MKIAKKFVNDGNTSDTEFNEAEFGEKAAEINQMYHLTKYKDSVYGDYKKQQAKQYAWNNFVANGAAYGISHLDNFQDIVHYNKFKDARWYEHVNGANLGGAARGIGMTLASSGDPMMMIAGGVTAGIGTIAGTAIDYYAKKARRRQNR